MEASDDVLKTGKASSAGLILRSTGSHMPFDNASCLRLCPPPAHLHALQQAVNVRPEQRRARGAVQVEVRQLEAPIGARGVAAHLAVRPHHLPPGALGVLLRAAEGQRSGGRHTRRRPNTTTWSFGKGMPFAHQIMLPRPPVEPSNTPSISCAWFHISPTHPAI